MSADPPARGPADDLDLDAELAALHTPRDPQHEYRRLCLALSTAAPGQLYFVELATARGRRHLPARLRRDGLARPYAYYNLAERSPAERQQNPFVSFRAFLAEARAAAPVEILYLDGFPAHRDFHLQPQPHDALEQLNLAREALGSLSAAVVFLAPPYLIALFRQHTQNLWSWRHHDFVLSTGTDGDFDHDAPQDDPWDFVDEVLPPLLAVDPEAAGKHVDELAAQSRQFLRDLAADPSTPAHALAFDLCEAGHYQSARQVLRQHPSSAYPVLWLEIEGRIAWALGETESALRQFWLAYTMAGDGRRLVPRRALMWCQLLQREFAAAQASLQELVADDSSRHVWERARVRCAASALSRTLGDLLTAEASLAQALKYAREGGLQFDGLDARLYHEQALLYLVVPQVERTERAEEAIRRAVAILEAKANPSIPLAAALHTLARVVALRDRSPSGREQAADYLRRALAMAEEPLGPEHPALSPLRQELARLSPA